MLKIISKYCKQHNLRLTELRYLVFELIYQEKKPIKAYDLLKKLQNTNPNAKPATIYRSLDFLIENNLIHRINKTSAYFICSHPNAYHQCYFLLCSECQSIFECCNLPISKIIHQHVSNYQFKLKKISVEIEGICKSCQEKVSQPIS